ncbi:MAG: T9SS type A sorting domain-containing protein [Flavobacteriales bacterium]|nr:T9SS type A sorting domain-containing protein [Flavobacteriales bacterium]
MKRKLFYLMALVMVSSVVFGQKSNWQKITPSELDRATNLSGLNKDHFETYQLNIENFKQQLSSAVLRGSGNSNTAIIAFPNEFGKLEEFRVYEAPILAPDIAAEFPNIKTYVGFSTDNSGTRVRFSVTPQGVQSMISRVGQSNTFLVPLSRNGNNQYIAYNKMSRANFVKEFECLTHDEEIKQEGDSSANRDADDQILRTFRIAISTTGEYTNFWDDGNATNGNAQADALAQVVSTLNRVNEVFEVDMAVTFQLVSGTSIIYPTAASDPYTGSLNAQLQTTLTAQIGEANYDIGHLFAYAGNNGNAGCIGCVCVNGQKGSGFSAHTFLDNDGGPYMTDFFDIDYVPHEMGHQMGGNHTFAFNTEGAGVNAEPGSGTSVMGYAGITGGNDVQDHSDAYFHYHSINQILNNLVTRTCWTSTPISNNPPVADAGSNFTIPKGTAFILKGSATDSDPNDVLSYCWEQTDSGATTNTNFAPTKTTGPLWRSRPPSVSPNRYMPIFSRVLAGQLTESNPVETVNNTSWETVSTVGRTLNFALTVRDRSEANGTGQTPQSSFDTMVVTVDPTAGPFTVTSQNTNVLWNVGTSQTVTWNVAGTNVAPVNSPTVNILLSIDGGQTFPFTVASNVTNDGSETFTVPAIGGDTTQARLIVEGNNNIFYAVNSTNFTIQGSEFVLNVPNPDVTVCSPNDGTYNFTYNTFLGFTGTTTFSANGLPSGATIAFSPATAVTDGTSVTATVSNTGSLAPGSYTFELVGTSGSIVKTANVTLNIFSGTVNTAILATPADGATNINANVTLTWNADANVQDYLVEIATDAAFTAIINSTTVGTNMYTVPLGANTQYYWRVTASNECATAATSSVFSFTTENVTCASFTATDTPITISATGVNTYTSTINVTPNLPITDVNVTINITHSWDADLDVTLTSPTGTVVELTTDNGGQGDNYTNTVFDQQATTLVTAGTAPFTGSFVPEGNLSNLNGQLSGGNWILTVTDDANFDGGSITGFTLNICAQGTLASQENTFSDFGIFPNPNNGEFTIKLNSDSGEKIKVTVFDVRGRAVFQRDFNSASSFEQQIQLDNIESGMYLVNVTDGEKQTTKKIIVK